MNWEESVQKHWEYVREVIRDGRDEDDWIHLTVRDYLAIIGYHYKTAMTHEHKHILQTLEESTT